MMMSLNAKNRSDNKRHQIINMLTTWWLQNNFKLASDRGIDTCSDLHMLQEIDTRAINKQRELQHISSIDLFRISKKESYVGENV